MYFFIAFIASENHAGQVRRHGSHGNRPLVNGTLSLLVVSDLKTTEGLRLIRIGRKSRKKEADMLAHGD
jgi:hypothetical protein